MTQTLAGRRARLNDLAGEPWLAEVPDIIALAARKGVRLTPRDIKGRPGDHTVNGLEWYARLEATATR